jgi:hypothetical protein
MSEENNFDKGIPFVLDKIANLVKGSSGKLYIKLKDKTVVELNFEGDILSVDIVEPTILGIAEQLDCNVGLFEKLRTLRIVGEILNKKGLSISILRKGKKTLRLGREATPTISSFITQSDAIQIDSMTQLARLSSDIKKNRGMD